MNHVLTLGDIVKLKTPYRPEEWVNRKPEDWKGFEYGIVVEIVSCQFTINGERYGDALLPRNVSLHLYDALGQLMIVPQFLAQGLMIPEYVDFHVSQLVLYKIASEMGYKTVANPPDWGRVWHEEKSML